jgi:hypothetical protein
MMTASISPCLHVDPENTSSPGFFVAGIDSPVSADWPSKDHHQSRISGNTSLRLQINAQLAAIKNRIFWCAVESSPNWTGLVSRQCDQFHHLEIAELIQGLSPMHN